MEEEVKYLDYNGLVLYHNNLNSVLSKKSDKSNTVTNVEYDATNKKIKKTINGTTTDVVTVATIKSDLNLSKTDVGLSNVTNDSLVKRSEMGAANGVATLDGNGKIPSSQVPSDFNEVIEGYFYNNKFYVEAAHSTEITGENGKLYIDISGKRLYRYDNSAFILISEADIAYTNTKITKTINGIISDVISASQIVTDGGGIKQHQDISGKADKSTTTTAGTYKSVTVNSQGIVTGGSNPTTLSGYGITDAKILNGIITLGSNTITPLTLHQDISGKADKSATVSNVSYNTSTKKLQQTINGTTTDVVTASQIISDGGAVTANTASLQVSDTTNKKINTSETTGNFILFVGGTNKFSVKDKDGTSFDVSVTPSIANNVTGSSLTSNQVILGNGSSSIKASGKTIATSLGSDDTTIPTSKAVLTAITNATAGLTGAMHFLGTSTTTITDGGTETPTIGGSTINPSAGDVVLYSTKEFIWTVAGAWELFGDEGSYALKTTKIEGTGVLGGGGTLETNRTITHNTSGVTAGTYGPAADVTGSEGNTIKVPQIEVDSYGHVKSVSERTYTSKNTTYTVGNKALKVSSNSGTATLAITTNEASSDRTLQIKGDGTYISGVVSGSSNAAVVTLSHNDPTTDSEKTLTANASGGSAAWSADVVKGVSVTRDAKGHVTGLSVTSGKIPSNPNTDRYVNSASFTDDSTNTAASPVKMTLTRAGSDSATVTANIPKVSSSTAGVAPKGAVVSSQSQSTKFLREDGTWATPSYTTNTNTHRPILVNSSEILGNNTNVLNLISGNNVSLTNSSGNVTIAADNTTTLTNGTTKVSKVSETGVTLTGGDNKFTVSDGANSFDVTVTPKPTWSNVSGKPSSYTPASHTHGNISNTGTLTDTAAAAAGNDYIVIRDADNAKILTSTIKGTDVADAVSKKHSHSSLTLSTTAQAYDGSHTLALPSSDPYSSARTPSSHTHGNILNDGTITSTAVTAATGVLVYDGNNKILRATAAQTRSIIGAGTSSFSGSYNDLTNKPTIPTNTNQLTNGAGYITGITKAMVTDALGYTPPTTDHTYNFSGTSFTSNNSTGVDANNVTYNAHTYYTSNGPSTSLGASTNDGALYSQAYSTSWVGQIAQDYRNGGLYVRGKNNGTWQAWKRIAQTGEAQPASDVYSWAKASSKPTYTASEVGAIPTSAKGVASGVATLDSAGKVPSSQLPSYVDDVLEYDTKSNFPTTGEAGKIYVDKSTNTSWRWSGSTYTQIKGDLAIGTTTGTAADGGVANTHYNNTSNPHSVTKAQVGLGSVVNTGDSATPVSGGTTKFTTGGAYTELNKKVDKVSGKGLSTNDYTTDEKNKLGGIASGAEVNQNAFSNVGVKVGNTTTTVAADAKTDTVTLIQGSNVTLTADTTNDTITIDAKDTTYSSKAAASGGTDVSLVTTGEKYTWNSKTSNTGTVTKVTAGTGLTGGDITTTGTIALATSGVTAGTYKRVTVDAYGRVTSGDNTDSDTKNTAGTTNKTDTKMFLVAATELSANPVTYSNSNCYIGTDNCLYSGGTKVLTSHQSLSNYYTKTQVDALTRHTRLTNFDLSVLKQAVADQNLEKYGLKVGDEKTINGHTYVIAGLNPMKGTSTPDRLTQNHVGLIVIPHTTLAWNASGNTSTGANNRGAGYKNSDLHYYLTNTLLPLVETDLGASNLLGHSKFLTNAVNTTAVNRFANDSNKGASSNYGKDANCKICALSEIQVYGATVWSSSGYDTGEACRQLDVFRVYNYTEIFGGEYPWLRDVASASHACFASDDGITRNAPASGAGCVAAFVLFN